MIASRFIIFFFIILSFSNLNAQECGCENCPVIIPDQSEIIHIYTVEGAINDDLSSNSICEINISFKHDYVGDMTMELVSPAGQTVVLIGDVELSGHTDYTKWNISFVPISTMANPDPGKSAIWSNEDIWGILGNFKGSYYPHSGSLENFSTGTVNGDWQLIIKDNSPSYAGELLDFSITFCNSSGIDCCSADGGTLVPGGPIISCVGSSALQIELETNYVNNAPDVDEYNYFYFVFEDSMYIERQFYPDLSGYEEGNYLVCGYSFFHYDVSFLPPADGTVSYDSILTLQQLSQHCGRFSNNCIEVEILPTPKPTILYEEICEGSFYFFNNQNLNNEGIYYDTLFSFLECDSILQLNLVSLKNDTTFENSFSCDPLLTGLDTLVFEGTNTCDSFLISNTFLLESDSVYVENGTCFEDEVNTIKEYFSNQNGCDSVYVEHVFLYPVDTTYLLEQSCNPQDTGEVIIIETSQYGCDSTIIKKIEFLESDSTYFQSFSCSIQDTGFFPNLFTNQQGCDSAFWVKVDLIESDSIYFSSNTCNPLDTGIFRLDTKNQYGCDSIYIERVSLLPSDSIFESFTTCNPLDSGRFKEVLVNQFGCDSIYETYFQYTPFDFINLVESTCDLGQVGLDTIKLQNQYGCDSLVVTNFILSQSDSVIIELGTCIPSEIGESTEVFDGEMCDSFVITKTILIPSDTMFTTDYSCEILLPVMDTQYFVNYLGCDSLFISELLPEPLDTFFISKSSCRNEEVGIDTQIVHGLCDSIFIIQTTFSEADTTEQNYYFCGTTPDFSEIVQSTSSQGCDSFHIYYNIFQPNFEIQQDLITCDIEHPETVIDSLLTQNGCDSIIVKNYTYSSPDTTEIEVFDCEINSIHIDTLIFENVLGCDSLLIKTTKPSDMKSGLEIVRTCNKIFQNQSDTSYFDGTPCDSIFVTQYDYFELDTTFINQKICVLSDVGVETLILSTSQGCDSIVVTQKSYTDSDTLNVQSFTCDIADVGIDLLKFTSTIGCDSFVLQNTFFAESDTTYQTEIICEPSEVEETQSLFSNRYGCDSLVITQKIIGQTDTVQVDTFTCFESEVGQFIYPFPRPNMCDSVFIQNVIYKSQIDYILKITEPSCKGFSDGEIEFLSQENTIVWENNETGSLQNLKAAQYQGEISDGTCTENISIILKEPPVLNYAFKKEDVGCSNDKGLIQLFAQGGTEDYSYKWGFGAQENIIENLNEGWYTFTITDENGCEIIDSISIEKTNKLIADQEIEQQISCNGDMDGMVSVTPITGTAPYSYLWGRGDTTSVIGDLGEGIYVVQIKDQSGCNNLYSFELIEPPLLEVEIQQSGNNLIAIIRGGTAPYDILWNTGDSSVVIPNEKGFYSVTVVDDNGCQAIHRFEVTQVDFIENNHVLIFPNPSNGTFKIELNNKESFQLDIFSVNGKRQSFKRKNNQIQLVAKSGIYFLVIKTQTKNYLQKIIVE